VVGETQVSQSLYRAPSFHLECCIVALTNESWKRLEITEHMRRAEAKVVENLKEDPASEPDQDPNTWLIEAKLEQDILEWETVRLDFRSSEIEAEIIESSMSEPNYFTIRTRDKSPLQKGDVIHVDVRDQTEN
jgi:hypothetical protein